MLCEEVKWIIDERSELLIIRKKQPVLNVLRKFVVTTTRTTLTQNKSEKKEKLASAIDK